jgi:hypothetical protein
MTQLDLFTAPHNGTPTSRAAAVAIQPNAGTLRAKVLEWLREHGPATDEEMQNGIPMPASTQRPRRVELVTAGLVVDSGTTRTTTSGRSAVLWRVG